MADNKTKHEYDGCPACKAGVDIYQSPVVMPKNAIFAPVTADELKNNPSSAIRSYLTLTDPESFRKVMPAALCNIAADKRLVAALASPEVAALLDADLVESFIKNRKSPLIDAEHRVFSFFERFFHRKKGHDSHKEGDALATRHDLVGVTSRYLRRILSSPEKAVDARGDVLSYLLPQLVVALCDAAITNPENKKLAKLRDAVCGVIANSLPEDAQKVLSTPESYTVKIIEDEAGFISPRDKELVAENYQTKTGIEFGFRKKADDKEKRATTKVQYFGKEYELKSSHFHIGSPEHKGLAGTADNHHGELHHVLQAKDGSYLVIGAPIQVSNSKDSSGNPAIQEVLDAKAAKNRKPEEIPQYSLKDFIPDDNNLITYFGGLTTTPYSDGVVFALSKTPLQISPEQFTALEKAQGVPDAARKPQKLYGRHAALSDLSLADNASQRTQTC